MELQFKKDIPVTDLVALYDSVNWSAYTKYPDKLLQAVTNSSYVVSLSANGELIGLARCISDDTSIMYLQDILVKPSHHRAGHGRTLMSECLKRYEHVRQIVLLTDDRPEQVSFYKSLGFSSIKEANCSLNAFVCIRND